MQHSSNTPNYGFLDLFFYLSIAQGISMGAANVLEMFDPAAQVGVNLQPANDLSCIVRLLPSRVTHGLCKEEIRPEKDDVYEDPRN